MNEATDSTYKVPLTKILEVMDHPNADRLDIISVYGFQVISKKGQYKVGDEVLYVPIDSILSPELECHLFPTSSKIKLHHNRVKQIRIRKVASQGMLISKEDVKIVYNFTPKKLEDDYSKKIKISKYEPPKPKYQAQGANKRKEKPLENNNFHKYNGLTNIKWSPLMFKEGEIVIYQEKIHGTNSRAGKVPFVANTIWKKIKKLFKLTPAFEFCYGSNNVQLQRRQGWTGFYGDNLYERVFESINVVDKLEDGEIIYGEIYGDGIQKNYQYGLKGEAKFILFDVKIINKDGTHSWLSPNKVITFAKERGLDVVPEVYRGPFLGIDHVKSFTLGGSLLAPCQKVREGIVVKSVENYSDEMGSKKALKCISEKYLDKDQSDFH